MTSIRERYDLDELRSRWPIPEYLAGRGLQLRRSGSSYRGACPLCGGSKQATKFAINASGLKWFCHGCGEGGDIFELVMLIDRMSFSDAAQALADGAGINPASDEDVERRLREADERRQALQAEVDAAGKARARAETRAAGIWGDIDRDSAAGCAYLERRGVAAAAHLVRFTPKSVCLPLRRPDGSVMNVVGRRFDGGQPKVRGLTGCGTDGIFGDVTDLASTSGQVILVEGVFDYLSASVMSPGQLVIGAHGAGRLPWIAREIAAHVRQRGLIVVPHADDVGRRKMQEAVDIFIEAGVDTNAIMVFDVGNDNGDLNDHLLARLVAA